jgi:hypothetical protein
VYNRSHPGGQNGNPGQYGKFGVTEPLKPDALISRKLDAMEVAPEHPVCLGRIGRPTALQADRLSM